MEWPTILVALGCWGGWVALLAWHRTLPWPLTVAGFALIGAWYMSLQHEAVHGHPTPWRSVNLALAGMPLALWLPYGFYRESHLQHHEVELTRPGIDPESFLVTQERWDRAGHIQRLLLTFNATLLGRLTIGPALGIANTLWGEARRAVKRPPLLAMWARHLVGAAVVVWVVVFVADVPAWQYLLGFSYFGLSLTYLRSFAEHRAVAAPATRSAVVRSGRFFGTLFLYNNLHYTHHAFPGLAWYRLPSRSAEIDAAAIAADGAGSYRGYLELIRRYSVRPIGSPVATAGDTVSAQ